MGELTQKYTDFKVVASTMESESKQKDELILNLQSLNDSLTRKKKKLEESYLKLYKSVSSLSSNFASLKDIVGG